MLFWQLGKSAFQCLLCTNSLPFILTTFISGIGSEHPQQFNSYNSLIAQYGWWTALTHWLYEHFQFFKNYNSWSHPNTGNKTVFRIKANELLNFSAFWKKYKTKQLNIWEKQDLGKRVALCSLSLNFYSFIILITIQQAHLFQARILDSKKTIHNSFYYMLSK